MYIEVIGYLSLIISSFGALLVFYGGVRAIIQMVRSGVSKTTTDFNLIRLDFTTKIVVALEFFIAGDLIETVVNPTLEDVVITGLIVAIRTVIGHFLKEDIRELMEVRAAVRNAREKE